MDYRSINYYIQIIINKHISVRELEYKLKSNEFERLPLEFRNKLIKEEQVEIEDLVPNPILIRKGNNNEILSEKVLKRIILEDIEKFMNELGNSFCFIGSEYKIKLGDRYNYIDILLFNYKYNCFIVVELKVTELKKEHIGQIQLYMNYVDKNLKEINQNKTIGIIIVKKDNQFVMEYCSDSRIFNTIYSLV